MPDTTTVQLDDFVERLITEKNYTSLTQAMRDQLKTDLKERVLDYLIASTIAKLSNDQVKELNEMLKQDAADTDLQSTIAKFIPDAPTFIGDTLFNFRQTFLGLR